MSGRSIVFSLIGAAVVLTWAFSSRRRRATEAVSSFRPWRPVERDA